MRESIRRSCLVAVITLLSFGPSAFASARAASLVTASSLTSGVATVVFGPLSDDWGKEKKKHKKVAASEGGNAALYLMFAGLACGSAVLLRSRWTVAAKSV
jgi:hypothetical protein